MDVSMSLRKLSRSRVGIIASERPCSCTRVPILYSGNNIQLQDKCCLRLKQEECQYRPIHGILKPNCCHKKTCTFCRFIKFTMILCSCRPYSDFPFFTAQSFGGSSSSTIFKEKQAPFSRL
uniref:Uncharacterized protein n=1 Tax=Oryza punctata TaxID=4537 RepID=A0A0E0K6X3_ORYPU